MANILPNLINIANIFSDYIFGPKKATIWRLSPATRTKKCDLRGVKDEELQASNFLLLRQKKVTKLHAVGVRSLRIAKLGEHQKASRSQGRCAVPCAARLGIVA